MYPLFSSPVYMRPVMKRILICIVFLLFSGIALAEQKRVDVPVGDSPSMGPADAPVTIIEFIDFQ